MDWDPITTVGSLVHLTLKKSQIANEIKNIKITAEMSWYDCVQGAAA